MGCFQANGACFLAFRMPCLGSAFVGWGGFCLDDGRILLYSRERERETQRQKIQTESAELKESGI